MKNRRDFLKTVGTVGATGIAAAVGVESTVDAQAPAAKPAPASAPVSHAYTFLSPPEAAFVEAAVDRLIPADDLTPGGTDCGVATFIDRQLAGAWGSGDRLYMQGPWQKGSPTQGYQSPLTPAEFFTAGVAADQRALRKTLSEGIRSADARTADDVLQGLERGTISLGTLSAQQFFDLLLNADDAGLLCRSALWRQPRQGRLEDDRLPRRRSRSTRSTSRPTATRSTTSSRRASSTCREDAMATRLKEVDVVIVGLGWTGGILAKELAQAGMTRRRARARRACAAPTRIFRFR